VRMSWILGSTVEPPLHADPDAMKHDRRLKDLFHYSFEQFPDGILILDHRHRCLAINDSAYELLGLRRSRSLSNKNINRLRFVRKLSERLNRKQAGSTLVNEFELSVTRPRARARELGVRVRRNFTPGCYLVVLHDITRRKRTEEALQKRTHM